MTLMDDFKARFPEFDPGAINAAWSGLESSWPCLYGGKYGVSDCEDEIILNLIGHLFTVGEQSSGPATIASSESVGSVSVTNYINQSMTNRESFFSSTKYGQQFIMMTQFRQGAKFV